MGWLTRLDAKWRAAGELPQRIVTGVALILVALAAILLGGAFYTLFVLTFGLLMILEWRELTRDRLPLPLGLAYIGLPVTALLLLPRLVFPQLGDTYGVLYLRLTPWPLLHLIAMVAATDTGAYFVGKAFGKRKLAPAISPGKTWEGLIGGVCAAGVVSFLFGLFRLVPMPVFAAVLVGIIVALLSQMGDLYESSLKRKAGVKNSGTILPGHGGALDRFDGLLFAAPVYFLLIWLSGAILLR